MKTDREYIELLKQYRIRSLSRDELQELLEWLDTDEGEEACGHYMDMLIENAQPFLTTAEPRHRIKRRIQRGLIFKKMMIKMYLMALLTNQNNKMKKQINH